MKTMLYLGKTNLSQINTQLPGKHFLCWVALGKPRHVPQLLLLMQQSRALRYYLLHEVQIHADMSARSLLYKTFNAFEIP